MANYLRASPVTLIKRNEWETTIIATIVLGDAHTQNVNNICLQINVLNKNSIQRQDKRYEGERASGGESRVNSMIDPQTETGNRAKWKENCMIACLNESCMSSIELSTIM